MQSKVLKRLWFVLAAFTAAASLFLAGCDGDDGDDGRPGRDAGTGPVQVSSLTPEQQADLNVQGEVISVEINSPPVVRFRLTDLDGDPIVGLNQRNTAGTQLQNFRFFLAKLVPGTNGSPSQWVNYLVTSAPSTTTPPAPVTISRPGFGGDREGTLVDNGDGTYTYTFARDITLAAAQVAATTDSGNNRKADLGDLTYDPNLTHRLVIAYSGNVLNSAPAVAIENPLNLVYDFIPATGARVTAANTQREIVLNESCKECHGSISSIAHSFADDTRLCVTCHTPQRAYGRAITNPNAEGDYAAGTQTYVSTFGTAPNQYSEVMGDFTVMIHKIHQGSDLFRDNYNYAGVEFDDLGYPQPTTALCRKCHREDAAAPQANNWFNAPNRKGCGSCHDNILFSTGVNLEDDEVNPGHTNATDNSCRGCHPATTIRNVHALELASPLNPDINPELTNFRYDIQSATVDPTSNDLTIRFRILSQTGTAAETPVTFVPSGPTVTAPLQGFTGSPSFLLAYARPQIGFQNRTTAMPIDYNNLGATSGGQPIAGGQPASISITQLLTGARGTLGTRDANGYYTATIPSANAFPRGASLRAVTLQGYFTQPASGTIEEASGRHTIAVVRPVQNDPVRRTVVDPAKCARCHEYFEAHGGNRVYETQMCVFCHNPNLTTSGRTLTDAQLAARLDDTDRAILTSWDFDFSATNAALGFPETSNNFKEMIHGIHAGGTRTDAFRDVRAGSGTNVTIIDAEPFVFPNLLKNCDACHISASTTTARRSYDVNLPANVLPTTMVTQSAATGNTPASILAARLTVPNPEDLVVPPITGSCVSCHDSAEAVAHIQANGGQLWDGAFNQQPLDWASNTDIGTRRFDMNPAAEQCVLCHGPGRVADVEEVHETDVDADDDDL